MAASICRRSALVSFLAVDNLINLLIEPVLPLQHGIEIIGLIRTLLWTQKTGPYDVPENFLQRLAVPLIHGEQEERQHHEDHADCGCTDADVGFQQEKERNTQCSAGAKADQLSE